MERRFLLVLFGEKRTSDDLTDEETVGGDKERFFFEIRERLDSKIENFVEKKLSSMRTTVNGRRICCR